MKQKTIGERLRILRNEYNLTSEKLATLVDVTRVTIDNIEKGTSNPYRSNVEKIATKLGSTYEWLSDGKGEMLPNGKVEIFTTKQDIVDPWQNEAFKALKEEVAFYRQLLLNNSGGKASFLRALNKTGSFKKEFLRADAA